VNVKQSILALFGFAAVLGLGVFAMSAADGHTLGQAALYGFGTACFGIAFTGLLAAIVSF
jgi:hypothetical protein